MFASAALVIGELEAKRDHRWKRIVLSIPSSASKEPDGRFRVRVGRWVRTTTEKFTGSMLIHRLIASPDPIPARASVSGFWPATTEICSKRGAV